MPKSKQIVQPFHRNPSRWRLAALSAALFSGPVSAGWDCQPTAEGDWICNAEPTSSTAPAQMEEVPESDLPREAPQPDALSEEPEVTTPPKTVPAPPMIVPQPPPPQTNPDEIPEPAAEVRRQSSAPDLEPPDATAPPGNLPPAQTTQETDDEVTAGEETDDQADPSRREAATGNDVPTPTRPAIEESETPSEPAADTLILESSTPPERPTLAETPRPSAPRPAFRSARDLDADIDWSQCGPAPGTAGFSATTFESGPKPTVIEAEADAAELDRDSDSALLTGDVRFFYGTQTLDADRVVYNRTQEQVTAEGNVLLQRPDVRLAGERLEMQLEEDSGTLSNAKYRVPAISARGTAKHAAFDGDRISRYEDITYTTCRPGNSDWLLQADALKLDHIEGVGTADSATLRFLSVPMIYLPRFTFPIDDRRRSGVLIPSVGISSNTGADISVPYYLNLAPNYDLTLVPRIMSKRGIALGGEFRFLTQDHQGTALAEFLPHDREYRNGTARGAASLTTHSEWGRRTEGDIRFNYVSDDDYTKDLGDSLAVTSVRQLERTGELNYHGDDWRLLGRVQHYQTIDPDITAEDSPYTRLPQLLFALERPDGIAGLTYHLGAEYVYFERDGGVDGHRFDINPGISLPLRRSWGYLEPKLSARYTRYELDDLSLTPLTDDAPDRTVGIFSLDGGLNFDRQTNLFGISTRQTLEPRVYYLYVPNAKQSDLPVFDTTELDFNFDNLFRENRFNGIDRFGDANQLTVALQSRTLSNATGEEILKASLGQIYYFRDRKVTLPGETSDDDSSSSVVGELTAKPSTNWRVRGGLQWDPQDGFQQGVTQLRYSDGRERVFYAAYRYRDGLQKQTDVADRLLKQTDVAAIWPLSPSTGLIARWNYSLRENRTLEALAGVQYGRCCWRVRAVVRQFTDSDTNDHNIAFMLQLELNGLGSLGDNIDSLLERGIYGYRVKDDD